MHQVAVHSVIYNSEKVSKDIIYIRECLNKLQDIVQPLKKIIYRICNNMGNCPTVFKQTTNQKKGHKLVLQWKNTRWENTKILKFSSMS